VSSWIVLRSREQVLENLNNDVAAGKITLEETQERTRTYLERPQNGNGMRDVQQNAYTIGTKSYLYALEPNGDLAAHPTIQGQNTWNMQTPDNRMIIQEMQEEKNHHAVREFLRKNPEDINFGKVPVFCRGQCTRLSKGFKPKPFMFYRFYPPMPWPAHFWWC
jgi:hypothetical protein